MTVDEIETQVRECGYECYVIEEGPYLREDFPSCDLKEAGDYYSIIVEDLKAVGLEFIDPYIEHDCITGLIRKTQ